MRCARSTRGPTGPIPAEQAQDIWEFQPTAGFTPAIVSSAMRQAKWAISWVGSIETSAIGGWQTAMCTFNRLAANAGRDICVEADATTKSCNADAQPATTFAAGWNIVCRPTSGFWRSVRSISLHERPLELAHLRDRRRPRWGRSGHTIEPTGALRVVVEKQIFPRAHVGESVTPGV